MAYVTRYDVNFTNQLGEEVEVLIQQLDGTGSVVRYECEQLEIDTNGEEQSPFDCILAKQLTLTLHVPEGDTDMDWDTLLASNYYDWKILVTINGTRKEFEGFIVPEEGSVPFRDKPYSITLKATTGLALLKGIPLTDVNGDNFSSEHTLIEFIAGALKKTGLELPIRCYCSYFNIAILDKDDSIDNDMFGQIYLDYRTFLKDAITFVSCYDALKIILDKFCTLEQWNGMWQIACIADKQYLRGDNFYVDYDENGANPTGIQSTEGYAEVGVLRPLYAINDDQQRSGKFSVKSVQTQYDYEIWKELPKNNKFERGTLVGSGTATDEDDLDGDGNTAEVIGTYENWSINDWDFGTIDISTTSPPFPLSAPEGSAYTKRIKNDYGVEISRKIVIDFPTTGGSVSHWLRSEPIPVNAGDKIKLNFQTKFSSDFTTSGPKSATGMMCYIISPSGSVVYQLVGGYPQGRVKDGQWKLLTGFLGGIDISYEEDENSTKYVGVTIESDAIPINGTLYIAMDVVKRVDASGPQYFSDVTLEYQPFIAGGYIPVKGDFYQRTQTVELPDVIEEPVKISDSPKKVLQGALLFDNGNLELTQQNWYRFNTIASPNPGPELFGFKDLLNLGRLNYQWRRMQSVAGTFRGLSYEPNNDIDNKLPIGFHKRYRLTDLPDERYFILVAPLKQDIRKGTTNVTFLEVSKDANDGTQLNIAQELKYIFT